MKSRYVIALLAVIVILIVEPALAQQSNPEASSAKSSEKDAESIRIDTSLVLLDGIVLNKRTKAVVGDLKRDDFLIFENNQRQEITHFSREELPLSVVLLLDVSGSVQPIIEEVRSAAMNALGNLKPQDSVATMIFGNRTKLITHLTRDREAIRDGLDGMWSSTPEVGYGTIITHAVYTASRYLKQRTPPTQRRAIILITDDEDFRYSVPPRETVLRELHESGAALCGIIVSHGKAGRTAMSVGTTAAITAVNPIMGGVLIGMKIFRKASSPGSTSRFFTENTGGVLVGAKKEEVGRVFIEMMQLLRTRYTFGYEAPETPDDGRLRQIKLTVNEASRKKKDDLVVFARSGYYYDRPGQRRTAPLALISNDPINPQRLAIDATTAQTIADQSSPLPAQPAESELPQLHQISKASLSPLHKCRPAEESQNVYQPTTLFLSKHSERIKSPDLVFNGACGAPDYFVVATSGDDLSMIADLGDVPIEDVTAHMVFRLKPDNDPANVNRFVRGARVEFNHTYAVLQNKAHVRGIFFFRVTGYLPNERVDLTYAVKHYQLMGVQDVAPGFDWTRKNSSANPEKP